MRVEDAHERAFAAPFRNDKVRICNGLATLEAHSPARYRVRPGMSAPDKASPADLIGLGIACAAAGGYFILVGFSALPAPGETSAPAAIVVAAGLAFLFAGLICVVRAKAGMSDHESDMPDSAPTWT